MTVDEALIHTIRLLERQGWVSYQTLRRRFRLDEAALDALYHDLVVTRQLAREEDGRRLVWLGSLQPAAGGHGFADQPSVAMPTPGRADGALPRRPTRLSPLIGRQAEDALLRDRWQRVRQGMGQVVVVRGEAGIGKSHLVHDFRVHGAGATARWGEGRCSPTMQHSAFHPVIDLMQQLAGIRPDTAASVQRQQLEAFLAPGQLPLSASVPLMARFLSIPCDTHDPALTLPPDRQRQQTLDIVVEVLQSLATQQPLLLILEDVHWADPSTIEVLERLIDIVLVAPIYLLLTCRPEFRMPGPLLPHITYLTLGRLTSAQIEALIQGVLVDTELPSGTIQQIVNRAEGIPLFAEELTRMVLSSQSRAGEDLVIHAIPATLKASLQARLEQLGLALTVAQTASVWGRAVTERQLQAVVPLGPLQLPQALERLVELDIFYEASLPPRVTYVFKHALIQDAVYNSLAESSRRALHRQVAQVLESQFPATVEALPELLAHHYTSAACHEQAATYWQRAGERALERSAYLESISHLKQGLAILQTQAQTLERIRVAVVMQRMLGAAITAVKGYTAPELASIYTHAQAQCRQIGDTELLFPVLQGLWRFYLLRCQLDLAWDVSQELLELAEQSQDASQYLRAHNALGSIMLHRGDVAMACATLEKGFEGYDLERRHRRTHLYVQEPGIMNLAYSGLGLALLGYLDQALQRTHAALELACDQRHTHSEALARIVVTWVHQYRRERHAVREHAEAALHLAVTHRFVFWEAMARMLLTWANAPDTGYMQAAAELRRVLTSCEGMGARLSRTYFLMLIAECYLDGGDSDQSLRTLHEAQEVVDASREAFCLAELHRLEGEVLLRLGDTHGDAAAAAFEQALQLARQQQTRLWELRAAVSWGRLMWRQGRHDDARALVAPVYQQCSEAFDTADLQAAGSLLIGHPNAIPQALVQPKSGC